MGLAELISRYEKELDEKRNILSDNLLSVVRSKSEVELLIIEHDLYFLEDVVADLKKVEAGAK